MAIEGQIERKSKYVYVVWKEREKERKLLYIGRDLTSDRNICWIRSNSDTCTCLRRLVRISCSSPDISSSLHLLSLYS